MKKLLAMPIVFLTLFLTACPLENFSPTTAISVTDMFLDKTVAEISESVEITIPVQYGLFRGSSGQKEVFTLKMGICIVDPKSGDCPVNAEPNGQITLPPTLSLMEGSAGAFYGELTATPNDKVLEHKLKLTSSEAVTYTLKPFTISFGKEPVVIDRPTKLSFE